MATLTGTACRRHPATALTGGWRYLAVAGPGLIVAFADTEAGSVTTAATSGAQFGMKLVLLQLLLIVPLFVVQEMTVRLGTVTGSGHAALIRERYGLVWAWVSLGTMLVTNFAALVTEFIGIAGAALIFGVTGAAAGHRRRDVADRRRLHAAATSAPNISRWPCVCSSCCSSRPRSPRIRRGRVDAARRDPRLAAAGRPRLPACSSPGTSAPSSCRG